MTRSIFGLTDELSSDLRSRVQAGVSGRRERTIHGQGGRSDARMALLSRHATGLDRSEHRPRPPRLRVPSAPGDKDELVGSGARLGVDPRHRARRSGSRCRASFELKITDLLPYELDDLLVIRDLEADVLQRAARRVRKRESQRGACESALLRGSGEIGARFR
jgi:hypothetical protein|eukprot:254598-Prymnesium_polylepis.1